MLLALLSFTRLATPHILTILFFAWYLVVNGLVGALVPSSYKWGFFVFGLFGLFFIWCVAVCLPTMCNAYPRTPGTRCLSMSRSNVPHSQRVEPKRVSFWAQGTSPLSGCSTRSVGVSRRVVTPSRRRRRWSFMGSWIFYPLQCSSCSLWSI